MEQYIIFLEKEIKNCYSTSLLDEAHNINHFHKVANHAIEAVKYEDLCSNIKEDIILASFLHDIDDKKIFPNSKDFENAKKLLLKLNNNFEDFDKSRIPHIIEMISLVSTSSNGDSEIFPKYKIIPRLCDRLEAIGIQGLIRCYQYSKYINRPFHNEDTIKIKSSDDLILIKGRLEKYLINKFSNSMIDHYYDKLLHLTFFCDNDYINRIYPKRMEIIHNFIYKYWKNVENDKNFIPTSIQVLNLIFQLIEKH